MKKILAMLLCILSACATNKEIKREYYENGNLKSEISLTNDTPNGISKFYKEDGTISREYPYKNGKFHGTLKAYENGKLLTETPYKDGKKDGVFKNYNEEGNLKEETLYIEDKDVWNKSYYETGELLFYRDDNISKIYYISGQIAEEIPLKDGKRHGIIKVYHPNGKLKKEIYYKEGIKDWQKEYDENGNLIKETNYYDNGDIWSEGLYENGKLVSGNFYAGYLISTTFFDENKEKTKMIMYDKDGTPLSETGYKDGEEIYKKKYNKDGNLIKE